jgi:hypothetical protein
MSFKQIQFNLKNCYGIKKLNASFNFSQEKKVHIIYASNGTMKTSFSKTIKDLQLGDASKDQINPEATTLRKIQFSSEEKEPLKDIDEKQVYVMLSIDQSPELKSEEQVANILLHEENKKRYDEIYSEISKAEDEFFKSMCKVAQISGKDNQTKAKRELIDVLKINQNEFLDKLLELKNEINSLPETSIYSNIDYPSLFNEKALKSFTEDKSIQINIKDYFERHDLLMDESNIYRKNLFDFNNAENLKKQFEKENFFKAEHSINFQLIEKNLSSTSEKKINSDEELDSFLKKQLAEIYKDKQLNKIFNKLNDALNRNQETKNFKVIIEKQRELIPDLENIDKFKYKTWLAYLKTCQHQYEKLINLWNQNKDPIDSLLKKASEQNDRWQKVINVFNKRFSVPFTYEIANIADSVLGREIPRLKLCYTDGSKKKVLENNDEKRILSTGEQRALYILHLIFEIESRKKNNQETIFFFDDIADSFDYKNKYAIIEYLDEILSEPKFYGFILTHNFDFFRTLKSRLEEKNQCYIASRNNTEIKIEQATEFKHLNPFIELKKSLLNQTASDEDQEALNLITLIPFTRNLIEYLDTSENNEDFQTLTSLVHFKTETKNIKFNQLIKIYERNFINKHDSETQAESRIRLKHSELSDKSVYETIKSIAEKISQENNEPIDIKSKLILSVAIRLLADDFMKSSLKKDIDIDYNNNQTRFLYKNFKQNFPEKSDEIEILKQVLLITPENIHLNSFMYEPILDTDIGELKKLYQEIKTLNHATTN